MSQLLSVLYPQFNLEENLIVLKFTSKLAGSFAHWMLYGVLVVQVCKSLDKCILTANPYYHAHQGLYYSAFPKDYRTLRLIVLLQPVLETVQTIMITHDLYQAIIFGFENPLLVNEVGTTWFSVPLLTALSTSRSGILEPNI